VGKIKVHRFWHPVKIVLATPGKVHYCLPSGKILPTPKFDAAVKWRLWRG